MKKYKLLNSHSFTNQNGSGYFKFSDSTGEYWGTHGYVKMSGTIPKESDQSFCIGMSLTHKGQFYYRCYEFKGTATERGILRVAKQFHDEIYEVKK